MTGPQYDGDSPIIRPYVPKNDREGRVVGRVPVARKVDVRLVGARPDVRLVLRLLAELFDVSAVSDFHAADAGRSLLDLIVTLPRRGGTSS